MSNVITSYSIHYTKLYECWSWLAAGREAHESTEMAADKGVSIASSASAASSSSTASSLPMTRWIHSIV